MVAEQIVGSYVSKERIAGKIVFNWLAEQSVSFCIFLVMRNSFYFTYVLNHIDKLISLSKDVSQTILCMKLCLLSNKWTDTCFMILYDVGVGLASSGSIA